VVVEEASSLASEFPNLVVDKRMIMMIYKAKTVSCG
jgi:hypothetical protein